WHIPFGGIKETTEVLLHSEVALGVLQARRCLELRDSRLTAGLCIRKGHHLSCAENAHWQERR
ncbi:unnamed protein product, partial [Ectocarpus sp. 12 AP-2014]